MDDRMLTTREVADRFGVDLETVRRWRKAGVFTTVPDGRKHRYRESEVLALLESGTTYRAGGGS